MVDLHARTVLGEQSMVINVTPGSG